MVILDALPEAVHSLGARRWSDLVGTLDMPTPAAK